MSATTTTTRTAQAVLGAALLLPLLTAGPALAEPTQPSRASQSNGTNQPSESTPSGLPAPQAIAGVPTAPVVSPALAAARAAAAALQAKVTALQTATEAAVEHYNEVAAALKTSQLQHARADSELQAARSRQAVADRIADQRLRDLYIAGGPPGLLDLTVGTAPGMDVFHQFDNARFFVTEDRRRFAAAAAAAVASKAAEQAMARTLATQQRLTREAAAATTAVQQKLAAEQKLLASASAAVQAVLAAEKLAQERAAAALAALVRAAERKAGQAGVVLSASSTLPADGKVSPFIRQVLAAAQEELGKPYRWGATGPGSYDCSGLVQQAFAAAGVALPRTSRQQWFAGTHPADTDVQPGDLLFWSNGSDPASIHHVAIYLGAGYMIAAPRTGTVVQVQPVYYQGFFGVTRVAPPATR